MMSFFYAAVVAFIALGALYELYCAFQRMGVRPSIWTGTLTLVALFVVAASGAPVLAVMGIVNAYMLVSLAQHLHRRERNRALVDWVFSLSAILYVGFTMVHFVLIVRIDGALQSGWLTDTARVLDTGAPALGLAWLCVALVATWATQVAAGTTGRLIARTRAVAVPSLLRANTGSICGIAAGTAIGGLAGHLLGVPVTPLVMWLCSGMLAVGAILGARCEVLIRRQLGTNLTNRTIPGRGGFLDRSASVRVTVPLAFYLASIMQWQN